MRFTLIVASLVVLVSCGQDPCENVPLSEAVSPDGRSKIVVFSRECGATTGANCQGTIIGIADPYPTATGAVFIVDGADVEVRWDSPKRITVKMGKGVRVFKREARVDGVEIEYP